ncbi:uncharacterized protein [Macrobrachium rosenbergii]|uniref:uncharacterized protein isoform X3 n=1 Tax=Macrobrachium rosenbergii TaxID=79674 RepID=UPI0034D73ED0
MNWEEELTGSVRHHLSGLCEEKVQQVVTHLIEVTGVESMEDTSLVTEADLTEILKPLQSRKLIAGWKPKGSEGVSTSPLTQPPQRVPMLVLDDIPGPVQSEWAYDFTIPWENAPPELRRALKSEVPPTPSLRRRLVQIVVEAATKKNSTKISKRQMSVISKK